MTFESLQQIQAEKMIDIVLDFDGTCVTHAFPKVGNEIGAVPVLRRLLDAGHRIILFTMRCNENPDNSNYLEQAENWFAKNGLPLFGVQKHPTQHEWTSSPKAYGQIIIDDAALGCPLKNDPQLSIRPFVDWEKVELMLEWRGVLPKYERTNEY